MENIEPVLSIENIVLTNFKNYENFICHFTSGVNCVLGLNGSGKTNLLDAVYYLCYTKSYFNYSDLPAIRHDESFIRIEGHWKRNEEQEKVEIRIPRVGKKLISVNEVSVNRLSDFIGQYAAVMITPDDNNLISGGSEGRRRFLDATLSLTNQGYLNTLLTYQKLLAQRNALLKDFAERNTFNEVLLDTFDSRIAPLADGLWAQRIRFIGEWLPVFTEQYQYFVEADERPHIKYVVPDEDMLKLLKQHRGTDMKLTRTSVGPHLDDLEFLSNGYPLKKVGSQGQQKSFMVALKLAQWRSLKDVHGVKPILLLDDIFDKLDNTRIRKLIQLMKNGYLGQVFITDTDAKRMAMFMQEEDVEANIILIKNGTLEEK